ncbi:MAG TPA: FAD-dependent oxidoreductase [Phycisphaerales bacterium]|nr:FAD-dependent oxidoreductase [Phycisphaerales bacterium]
MPNLFTALTQRHNPVDPARRREFLKASLALGAGLMLSRSPLALAGRFSARRVVVVGAGLSGLACAYELKAVGHDVTVVEATNRVGGRVFSWNKAMGTEFIAGRNVEGGGELIGSNHPLWLAYAAKFGLSMLDVHESEHDFPILLDGKLITGEESATLYEEMDAALNAMNEDAADVDPDRPWTHTNAKALDAKSIAQRIAEIEASDLCRTGVTAQLSGDNAVACDKASYLGLLTAVKGGGLEKYWTETEVYRCNGGNGQLAKHFAAELGDRVTTKLPVRSIEVKGDRVVVTCADSRTIECDDVVLAVPPSAWHRIDIKPGFPAALSTSGIQMGTAVKYFSHVKRRYWQDNKLDPVALCNLDISWTWDSTDGQDEPVEGNPNPPEHPACLAAFSGGPAAERARSRKGDEQRRAYSKELNTLYPGYADFVVTTRFMDWPDAPFTGAGYSFPAPGQVTGTGPLLAKPHAGRVHLAGEHCCYKFVGYMEGALQSGVAVAKRIAGA